jgi:hypothetical protein
MTENISIITSEEEKKLWFEEFPMFINYIKMGLLETNHFSIVSNGEHFCSIQSNHTFKHWSSFEMKNFDIPFITINIGDKYQTSNRISFEEYSLKIEVEFFKRKIVKEKTIFGVKEKVENERVFSHFYPIHLTPPNITDNFTIGSTMNYGEKKNGYINENIEWFINRYKNDNYYFDLDFDIFIFLNNLQNTLDKFYIESIQKGNIQRKEKLESDKKSMLIDLDKDSNGEVDLVDGESFNKLLTKNQKSIVDIDKNYIQKFVKISMYLKTKKSNTQKIFDSIKDTKNDTELNELVNLLKNQIHTYDLLVFHSINMITSLVESDLITFYEIYECFDELGVFNSNWENEVSDKLTNIGNGIKDLMYSIYQMENKIVNSISNLTYVTQDSFRELNLSVNNQLSSIDSSIKFNNLLTGIQTYQMYKINQNTKRIN